MAGPLSSANRDIREAEQLEQDRKLARLRRPRLLTDQLLMQVEELNLDDVVQVPERLRPTLDALRESLRDWPQIESRFGSRLQPGTPTSEVIEIIFAIQEILSPPRAQSKGEDEDLMPLAHKPGWPFEPAS
ncbi:MAG TPA: hypothetical protein VLS53_01495 [Candidatus Dormibacteraeota bacterium]|nr:hypothetical protein [Candidatus Dormibacteraeota bacterium]